MSTPVYFHAIVLSAGFGTRLRPLTDETPKPLVLIGDVPLLVTTVTRLFALGARKVVVNVHYHAGKISNELKRLNGNVHVSLEERILGTAGGIFRARAHLRGAPIVVVNGDIVGELPVRELLAEPECALRLALVRVPLFEGTVGVGSRGEVVRLRGETFGDEVASGDYMGVARLSDGGLHALPEEGCLVGDFALPRLRRGEPVDVLFTAAQFLDVGSPAGYLAANMNWLKSEFSQRSPEGYRGANVHVSPEATICESILGDGARVLGCGLLSHCVVLPGAVATAPLNRAIVTPAGNVLLAPASLADSKTDRMAAR